MAGRAKANLPEIVAELRKLPPAQWAGHRGRYAISDANWERVLCHLKSSNADAAAMETMPALPAPIRMPEAGTDLEAVNAQLAGDATNATRYRVVAKLGKGGMGTVYKAEQRFPVSRVVAVKMITAGVDTPELITRFEAERQALALMNHPNVAKVFDAGSTRSGRPFFAMEYVPGVSLTQYCDDEKLSVRQRLVLFLPICQAVQHAHQKGIIHRDLKPGNILVQLIDGKALPKVIDFGIAKATIQSLTQHTLHTQCGTLLGTPEYMSPEQALTSGLDVDTRTDIYSLGVILYELLTGTLPFDAKALRSGGLEEMARTIREIDPPSPSDRLSSLASADDADAQGRLAKIARSRRCELSELRRDLSGDLDWIVLKAMEKERARRYETANGLVMDIGRYLNDEPVLARPASTIYRLGKLMRRHKATAAATIVSGFAVLLGFGLAAAGYVQARHQRDAAIIAKNEAVMANASEESARLLAQQNAAEAVRQSGIAQLRLAEGLIAQADSPKLAARGQEAKALCLEAYEILKRLRQPTRPAELALWSVNARSPSALLTLSGHKGLVNALAFSPDAKLALSGSADNTLKLWDVQTGREIRGFSRPTRGATDGWAENQGVTALAWSGNGKVILSGSGDGQIESWDVNSSHEVRTFDAGHGSPVSSIAVSPDWKLAASGGQDGTVKLWDVQSGKEIRRFSANPDWVTCVAFSPDGMFLMAGASARTPQVWNLRSGQQVGQFTRKERWVNTLAFSSDGKLALLRNGPRIDVWDVPNGVPVRSLRGHRVGVKSAAFSPDGRLALSGSMDGVIKLWDLNSGAELRTLSGHSGNVVSLAFSPDGRLALSGAADKTLKLWDVQSDSEAVTFRGHQSRVTGVGLSPDRRTGLSVSLDNTLRLWDVATGHTLRVRGGKSHFQSVALSPDGKLALSGAWDGGLSLWDSQTAKEIRRIGDQTQRVRAVAFSTDARFAASAGDDNAVRVWDLVSGQSIQTLTSSQVDSVAFSPDGSQILTGNLAWDVRLQLWDVKTGRSRWKRPGTDNVNAVAFSPDGGLAISANDDWTLRLWEMAAGREMRTFIGHDGGVNCVAFSPDGKQVLSGSDDHTLRLWDVSGAREVRILTGHTDAVTSVAFSSDGVMGLSGSSDRTMMLWDFGRGGQYVSLEPQVLRAQQALQANPNDPQALLIVGQWFAFRGLDEWAADLLGRARAGGGAVPPLLLARCDWKAGRLPQAASEFQRVLAAATDVDERSYVKLCLQAVQVAAIDPVALASQGRFKEAVVGFAHAIDFDSTDHWNWYRQGCLLAYLDDRDAYEKHCRAMLERFAKSEQAEISERAAKTCLLLPGVVDPHQMLAITDKAVARAGEIKALNPLLPWFRLAKALALYRCGDFRGCQQLVALLQREQALDDAQRTTACDLLLAMSRQQLGDGPSAKVALDRAEQRTQRGLPKPAGDNVPGGLENWLICQTLHREARLLITGKSPATEPASSVR